MSEKTPTSLHNSYLFLNSLKDFNKRSGIDNGTSLIARKSETFHENNNFVPLRTFYFLPPLHFPAYLRSYLLTKKNVVPRAKQRFFVQQGSLNKRNKNGVNAYVRTKTLFLFNSVLQNSVFVQLRFATFATGSSNAKQKSNKDVLQNKVLQKKNNDKHLNTYLKQKLFTSFYGKGVLSLRYELRSLTPHSKAQTKAIKKYNYLVKKEKDTLKQTEKIQDVTFNNAILPKQNLKTLRERVFFFRPNLFNLSSVMSREFFLITINLILLTVLAVAQRSQGSQKSSITGQKPFYTILCESKIPNVTPSYVNVTTACKNNFVQKLGRSFVKPNQALLCIQNSFSILDGNTTRAFQYYLPFYTSQNRIFAETDTIPSKKSAVLSSKISNVNNLDKAVAKQSFAVRQEADRTLFQYLNLCTALSQSVLQNLFYKYGFLVVSSSKRVKESQIFKEIEKNSFAKLIGTSQIKPCSELSETENFTGNPHDIDYSSYKTLPLITEIETSQQETSSKKGRVKQSFVHVNSVPFVLHKNIKNSQVYSNLIEATHTEKEPVASLNEVFVQLRFAQTLQTKSLSQIFVTAARQRSNTFFTLLKIFKPSTPFLTPYNEDNKSVYPQQNSQQKFVLLHPSATFFKQKHTPVFSLNKTRSVYANFMAKRSFALATHLDSQIDNKNQPPGSRDSRLLENCLPVINKTKFSRGLFVLNDADNSNRFYKKENIGKSRNQFPLAFVWSRFNLSKLHLDTFSKELVPNAPLNVVFRRISKGLPAFAWNKKQSTTDNRFFNNDTKRVTILGQRLPFEVQDVVPVFSFRPDNFIEDNSVSGYLFPELQQREIVSLFIKRAIFNKTFDSFDVTKKKNQIFFTQLFNSLTTPFHTFKSRDLINQVLSTFSLTNQNVFANQKVPYKKQTYNQFTSREHKINVLHHKRNEKLNVEQEQSFDAIKHVPSLTRSDIDDITMRYTHVSLDEIQNVRTIFKKLGRDYEDYVRQPKDSLPALIISPSLEDDREIEEEGIQIFRKRDFIKNKKVNPEDKYSEQNDPVLLLSTLSPESSENKNILGQSGSKSEMQNAKRSSALHQLLVKNALRQAQEEIDSIAKKEEKGSEKDKQVIPPLTRLEALYTIRNREKKREQAKDLVSRKEIVSSKNKAFTSHLRSNNVKRSTLKPVASLNHGFVQRSFALPLPLFDELFLYSDKTNDCSLPSIFTPWLFSKLGDKNLFTDRKHSFWGEISLSSKKLTAQEQRQIFQQKVEPLLKEKTKKTNLKSKESGEKVTQGKQKGFFNPLPHLFVSKLSTLGYNNADRSIASITVPTSLLSQFSVINNANFKKNEDLTFQISSELRIKSIASKNRVYFYDNLSQNKPCQGSAPKTKGTALQSPVLHRVWQPKRMEPSTFRVLPRNQTLPVVPQISQKDWKNIIEWQLKKHFVEEDKRLLPLSLNNNKKLKIKKINLYLPWVSIKKAVDFLIDQEQTFFITGDNQRLRAYVQNPVLQNSVFVQPCFANKNRVFVQRSFSSTKFLPLTSFDFIEKKLIDNDKATCYWRLPIQKNTHTLRLAAKKFTQIDPNRISASRGIKALPPKTKGGICKTVFNEYILFEAVTKYSWLFIHTFVLVLMFKQIFTLVYNVGLKDFFINFLNSEFGRTITSEEFRYSIQNTPLTEFYMPKRGLTGLFGLEKNKVQLLEIVWFLRNKCQGRNGPRGVLLIGPPGVESVSVVQAIAGEAGVPIIVQSLEKIAQDNEPQRQLEQLYMRAQKKAPCVLFLDKLDTVGARRDQILTGSTRLGFRCHASDRIFDAGRNTIIDNDSQQNKAYPIIENDSLTVNSVTPGNKLNVVLRLLTILDGITQSSGVVTVATAQDLTKLDPALLRPKRFDRKIYLSLPNQQDRVHLFKVETQSIGHSNDMPWDYLSLQAESMCATDIRSAINYSLFKAALKNSVHTVETLKYGVDCVKTLTSKRSVSQKQ